MLKMKLPKSKRMTSYDMKMETYANEALLKREKNRLFRFMTQQEQISGVSSFLLFAKTCLSPGCFWENLCCFCYTLRLKTEKNTDT